MDEIPQDIHITKHAWRQFVRRWPFERPVCLTNEFRDLLRRAEPEDLGAGAVIRALQNGKVPAKYYTVDGWRFVVSDDFLRLITVERVIHKKPKGKVVGRRRSRRRR